MSEVFIVYLPMKKNINHIEILKIFHIEKEAYKFKAKYNENRPLYTLASVKSFKVEEPADIWFKEQKEIIRKENFKKSCIQVGTKLNIGKPDFIRKDNLEKTMEEIIE